MATHSILSGEFHGQRTLVGYSPWGHKESDMTVTNIHMQIMDLEQLKGGPTISGFLTV